MNEGASDDRITRMAIELDPGEPLRGLLSADQGPSQRFFGWLELANALDALRGSKTSGGAPEPDERK